MQRLVIPVLAALGLAACSTTPPIEHIVVDDSSAGVRNRVRIVADPRQRVSLVQHVSALSCRRVAWDPDATEADAIAQLQIKAARLDATGLANVRCEPPMAATLQPNCWKSIVCHGDAVHLE